ncbi:MAG: ribosome maturation factor RimM [Thiotrichales bacterium]
MEASEQIASGRGVALSGPAPVTLGRLTGLYGVKGWLKVFSHTQPRENILQYRPWLLRIGDQWQSFKVEQGQAHGKGVLVKLAGCDDRDQAARLIGTEIAVERSQLGALGGDEYYWADLIGLSVTNLEGVELGVVTGMMETGANDVLVVEQGERERLVPYVNPLYVKRIDLAGKRMVVDWDADF